MRNLNEQFAKRVVFILMLIICISMRSIGAQTRFTPTVADKMGIVIPPLTTEKLIWDAYLVSWAETYKMKGGGTALPYFDLPAQLVDPDIMEIFDMVKLIYDIIMITANQEGKKPYDVITFMANKMDLQQRNRFYFRLFEWGKLSGLITPVPTENYDIQRYLSELKWSEDQWKN